MKVFIGNIKFKEQIEKFIEDQIRFDSDLCQYDFEVLQDEFGNDWIDGPESYSLISLYSRMKNLITHLENS